MKTAIIIGFHYKYAKKEYQMPNILIDVYRAYKHAINIECDNIIVITDHINIQEYQNENIYRLIINGDLDKNFISFDTLISNNLLISTNINAILEYIKENTLKSRLIYIYYSGHSILGNAIIPANDKTISYKDYDRFMFSSIISIFPKTVNQIFFILDCCSSTGLNLGFIILNNIITYNPDIQYYDRYDIICISSTDIYKESIISHRGSIFTEIFFKEFKECKTLHDIYDKMSTYDIHISIRANIPRWLNKNIPIWAWIRSPHKLYTYYNPIKHTIVLHKF